MLRLESDAVVRVGRYGRRGREVASLTSAVGRVVVIAGCCLFASCASGAGDASDPSESAATSAGHYESDPRGDARSTSTSAASVSTTTTSAPTTTVSTLPPTTTTASTLPPTTSQAPPPGASIRAADGSTVPSEVAATANAIIEAARAGDYARLGALAAKPGFTYDFGDGGGDPGEYWRSNPGSLTTLVTILSQRPAYDGLSGSGTWIWPGSWVFASEEDDAAYGPRLGIAADGSWEWFVLGGD